MAMTLYGYWRSSASYRVRIALNLKEIDYAYEPVHLVKDGGEQHSQEYIALNPSHLVPTLVDTEKDIVLNQSLAIIEYLDERFEQHPLLPTDKLQRARVRTAAYDIACDTQPIANLRILQYVTQQLGANDSAKVAWARHWIEKGLSAYEARIKNSVGDFSFGFDVTLADICLIPQVYNAERFGLDMSQWPLIQKVNENCLKLAAFEKAIPENQPDAG